MGSGLENLFQGEIDPQNQEAFPLSSWRLRFSLERLNAKTIETQELNGSAKLKNWD